VTDFIVNPNWSADWSNAALRERWAESYERVGQLYVEAWRHGDALWISTIDTKIMSHIKDGYLETERCDLGRRDLVVAPAGDLFPCDRLVGEGRDGRWSIGHIDSGVDTSRLAAITHATSTLPADCLSCAIARRCRNRCACANLAMTGTVSTPSDALCFHEQLSIRVADDAAEALHGEGNPGFIRRHYRATL
jgi:uncharacterized protein